MFVLKTVCITSHLSVIKFNICFTIFVLHFFAGGVWSNLTSIFKILSLWFCRKLLETSCNKQVLSLLFCTNFWKNFFFFDITFKFYSFNFFSLKPFENTFYSVFSETCCSWKIGFLSVYFRVCLVQCNLSNVKH